MSGANAATQWQFAPQARTVAAAQRLAVGAPLGGDYDTPKGRSVITNKKPCSRPLCIAGFQAFFVGTLCAFSLSIYLSLFFSLSLRILAFWERDC